MKWFGLSIRLFFIILGVMVLLAWQVTLRGAEMIEQGTRQAVETTLVDTAQLLVVELERDYTQKNHLDAKAFAAFFNRAKSRTIDAKIYDHHKTQFTLRVYLTDDKGIVLYDSEQRNTGDDFSKWNDVYFALRGKYGARSSRIEEGSPQKMMVIALPLYHDNQIIGTVAVAQPYSAYDFFSLDAAEHLRGLVLFYLFFALLVLGILAWWLARSLSSITDYAEAMAANKLTEKPKFSDGYLYRLAQAVSKLRGELDGKAEVEQYVHGLTHELKTPLTAIRAAGEFLREDDLSAEERKFFSEQIIRSNKRLQSLIERLLQLARLEKQHTVGVKNKIYLQAICEELEQQNSTILFEKKLKFSTQVVSDTYLYGDKLLITQALQNLLINAIEFADVGSDIELNVEEKGSTIQIQLHNIGSPIPEYALPRLTERFFSLPRPHGQPKSTGLGLSFVKQIMLLHDGYLQIKNTDTGVLAILCFPSCQYMP